MERLKGKLTPSLLLAAVLVLGLLTAGSAAWLKGSPAEEAGEGAAEAIAERAVSGESASDRSADMPRLLPMPPRDSTEPREDEFLANRGVTRGEMLGLLTEVFGTDFGPPETADAETGEALPGTEPSTADAVVRSDVARAVVAALGLEEVARDHAPTEPI